MFQNLSINFKLYLATYSLMMLLSIFFIIKNRRSYNIFTKEYFQFIFATPRFIIYILGTLALVIPVKYLNLHSWDYPIAVFQPLLSYLTAPWAVSVFAKLKKRKARYSEAFVAFCMMLFCGSWSVEIYLLFRDGYYMPDWIVNIPIGICCYILIGNLWNFPLKNDKSNPLK